MTQAGAEPRKTSELALRIVSGIVMIAAALLATWLGGLVFIVFWTLAGVAVGVEWAWLAAADPHSRRNGGRAVAVTLGAVGVIFGFSSFFFITTWVIGAILVAGIAITAMLARPSAVVAFGVPYGAAAFFGVILLRSDLSFGLLATLWLFAVVWSTDIGAYAAGRTFGGPKLAPRISPNKTWSGAIGGAIAGTGAGVGVAAAGGMTHLAPVAVIALLASVVTEIGDLFESGAKRAFGAKDSSQLIPGHGGLMDRLDGFLVAATLAAAIGVARGGLEGAGQGLLRW